MATKKNTVKSLSKIHDKGFDAGVRHALSIAVNHFNCPEEIREGVFQWIEMNKKK